MDKHVRTRCAFGMHAVPRRALSAPYNTPLSNPAPRPSCPSGGVPGDKHQVPGPQSASNGSCSIINVARAIKYSETQSETTVDEIKFNKFVPASVQVLSWPSSLVDTPQSLLSELEPQTSNTKPLPSPVLLP